MSADTVIQWANDTVNFWWGCTRVSAGCAHCYAEKMARFLRPGLATWGSDGLRWLRVGEATQELLRLNRRATKDGKRRRVFINSMADTFEDRRDLDAARAVLFSTPLVVPNLDLLLLTKRPENIERLVFRDWLTCDGFGKSRWPRNVWVGFSAENQDAFGSRWPIVQNLGRRYDIPVLFASAEPLLGPLDLAAATGFAGSYDEPEIRGLNWLILGGESGRQARPCSVNWIRSAVSQCRTAGISVFVKQLGRKPSGLDSFLQDGHGANMAEWPSDLRIRELPQLDQP